MEYETLWYYKKQDRAIGPLDEKQISNLILQGTLSQTTLVRMELGTVWSPLSKSELSYYLVEKTIPVFHSLDTTDNRGDMSGWDYFIRCISSHYKQFEGRASRKEYSSFFFFLLLSLILSFSVGAGFDKLLNLTSHHPIAKTSFLLSTLFFAIPYSAVMSRRLHDINVSGWGQLIAAVPYIGILALFVMTNIPSHKGANYYGMQP